MRQPPVTDKTTVGKLTPDRKFQGSFSPLRVELVDAVKGRWQLTEELTYSTPVGPDGEINLIVVPKGFYTDFDSVPRLPFVYWITKGVSFRPPIVHDYLYYSQAGKEYADKVFYEAMITAGVRRSKAFVIWLGVALFGSFAYKKYS